MINHLYIDNFRCFTNFEWKPGALSLLLGDNGSGKTSIFDVLERIRDFVTKVTDAEMVFPAQTRTAWDRRREQTFEIGIAGNGGQYTYRLIIEHYDDNRANEIKLDELHYDDILLYKYCDDHVHLYQDDGSEGPVFPYHVSQSAIPTIPASSANTRLTWFRKRLSGVHVYSPAPLGMSAVTEREIQRPDRYLANFVSWLRFLSNDLGFGPRLIEALKPVMDGFVGMEFKPISETAKQLLFAFDYSPGNSTRPKDVFKLPFNQLSEGQRCLTALYTSLLAAEREDITLCLDEPDNYVALREIQPWVVALEALVEEQGKQCLLISHHPELINSLAAEHGVTVYREAGGPARIKAFEWAADGVSPAEIVARGWNE